MIWVLLNRLSKDDSVGGSTNKACIIKVFCFSNPQTCTGGAKRRVQRFQHSVRRAIQAHRSRITKGTAGCHIKVPTVRRKMSGDMGVVISNLESLSYRTKNCYEFGLFEMKGSRGIKSFAHENS